MSIDLSKLYNILQKFRYVREGDYVLKEDINNKIDFLRELVNVLESLYNYIKSVGQIEEPDFNDFVIKTNISFTISGSFGFISCDTPSCFYNDCFLFIITGQDLNTYSYKTYIVTVKDTYTITELNVGGLAFNIKNILTVSMPTQKYNVHYFWEINNGILYSKIFILKNSTILKEFTIERGSIANFVSPNFYPVLFETLNFFNFGRSIGDAFCYLDISGNINCTVTIFEGK